MRKPLNRITACIMLVIAVFSCKKNGNDLKQQSSGPKYTYQLIASINGIPYSQSGCYYSEQFSFLTINNDSVAVNTYPHIGIQVINTFDTGTWDLASAGANCVYSSNAQSNSVDVYGNLHVTTRTDSVITGTFSFTCVDSTKVTNGSFTAQKK